MDDGLIVIISVIIGMVSTQIIHERDRRDKYRMALIKKRFEVSQQAFNYSKTLLGMIHGNDIVRIEAIGTMRQWFNENNLYLPPSIRDDFDRTLSDVDNYKSDLLLMNDLRENGPKADYEDHKKSTMEKFQSIRTLNRRIQNSLDVYYKGE